MSRTVSFWLALTSASVNVGSTFAIFVSQLITPSCTRIAAIAVANAFDSEARRNTVFAVTGSRVDAFA